MTDRTDIDPDRLKQALLGRRAELLEASHASAGTREAVELDQTKQGRLSRQDALMQQEMAKETERRRQGEIVRIDKALTRMDSGDYGYCIACDEEIAARRLELDPSIMTCIACASKL